MRTHFLLIPYLCTSAALLLALPLAFAQASQPGLITAIEAAWQRSPQARTLEARRNEIAAERDAARSWIAGSPVIGMEQRSDRWTDRTGVRETELSVSTPIWLPGQLAVRQKQAEAGNDDLEAQIAVTRLAIAGEVRESLWRVAAAREALAEAMAHRHHLDVTVKDVMRRVTAGDLARTDGMLAQQELLEAQAEVASAQAKLHEATSNYRVLTGLSEIPPAEPEPIAVAMREPHPRMLAARASLQHAQAMLAVVSRTRSEPPSVGMTMRREKESATGATASSVGFAVQIPIGTSARNRPLETAARTRIETASAEAEQAEAALQAEVELARQQLDAAHLSLNAASSRAALAREHVELITKAFRLGERGLSDLLHAQTLLHDAEAAQRQQRIAIGLAHARLNQALGIVP